MSDKASTSTTEAPAVAGRLNLGLGLGPERDTAASEMSRLLDLSARQSAEIARLRAELARCGGDNCMGRRCDDATNWVTEQSAQARVAAERERCGQVFGSREVAMTAELGRLRAELADALHAMRAYARENPRHEYQGATQDPNGVHAWLARNDGA